MELQHLWELPPVSCTTVTNHVLLLRTSSKKQNTFYYTLMKGKDFEVDGRNRKML